MEKNKKMTRKPSRRTTANAADLRENPGGMDAGEAALAAACADVLGQMHKGGIDPEQLRVSHEVSHEVSQEVSTEEPVQQEEPTGWPRKLKVVRTPINRQIVLVDFGDGKELTVRVKDNFMFRRGMEINVQRTERKGMYQYHSTDRVRGLPRRMV